MQLLIFIHAFFAFSTLIMGPSVFLKYNRKIWAAKLVWIYLIAHFLTAITAFTFGDITEISPFKILAVLTIFNFATTCYFLQNDNFQKARQKMFPPYIGLCIAFVGTLHPERLLGYRFFIKGLQLNIGLATNIWIFAMIFSAIAATIVAINNYKSNRKSKLQNS